MCVCVYICIYIPGFGYEMWYEGLVCQCYSSHLARASRSTRRISRPKPQAAKQATAKYGKFKPKKLSLDELACGLWP